MTGLAVGAALFVVGLAWTFVTPRLAGRTVGLAAMSLGSLTVMSASAAPGRLVATVATTIAIVPMLLAAIWLSRRLDRGRTEPTSLDEQPR